ncbi:MAG: MFS transporter [Sphingomonas sp.]|nr:MFS transporter [Sphingomonas sp.]
MLSSSLAFIDGSVTNVALPAIGTDLHATAADLQWTVNAYLLPLSALLLLGGAAGDHFGRRKLLVGGVLVFALASVACALAPGLALLLTARAVQGVGAAIVLPNSLAILGSSFEGEARGRAIGTWAATSAIAGAVGPPIGGWLVDTVGWRSIFYVNVPVAAFAILLALRYAPESSERGEKLDWLGGVLATLALGEIAWGLTIWSSMHGFSMAAGVSLALGIALTAGFVLHQKHLGDHAMMPLALFGSRAFAGLSLLTFLVYGALGGLLVLLPFVLIEAGGYSALNAGFALLPFPLAVSLASRFMGRLAGRLGARLPLTFGPVVTGIGFALMVRIEPQASYWTSTLPAMLVISLGMAATAAPLTTAVLASVDSRHTGTASGFNSAIARTGGLIATAVTGAVIASAGAALVATFHVAALVGAAMAWVSGAAAWLTLPRKASES